MEPDSPSDFSFAFSRGGRRRTLAVITLGLIVTGTAAVVWLAAQPRLFRSTVLLEVRDVEAMYQPPTPEADVAREHRAFPKTQHEALREKEVLFPVIDQLDLGSIFAKGGQPMARDEVYPILVRSIETRIVRDTGLVKLEVYFQDPNLAARIANTIATVFAEQRFQALVRHKERGIERLEKLALAQRANVAEARAELAAIRERFGIVDPDPDNGAVSIVSPGGAENGRRYAVAKDHYLGSRKTLETAELTLVAERMEQYFHVVPVKVWDQATPATNPIWLRFPGFRVEFPF